MRVNDVAATPYPSPDRMVPTGVACCRRGRRKAFYFICFLVEFVGGKVRHFVSLSGGTQGGSWLTPPRPIMQCPAIPAQQESTGIWSSGMISVLQCLVDYRRSRVRSAVCPTKRPPGHDQGTLFLIIILNPNPFAFLLIILVITLTACLIE